MASLEGTLARLGRRRTEAAKRLALVEADLAVAVLEALAAGVPKKTIGELAGLNRQTVYNWIRRSKA